MRLENAKQIFLEERGDLEETLKFVMDKIGGFETLSWEENPGIRLKVRTDKERFFIVSIAKYGEYKRSKTK